MQATPLAIELPGNWTGSFDVQRTPSGTYVGIAKLRLGGIPRCVLVITQQLSGDSAFERAKLRAKHFVDEWAVRPRW